METNRTGFRAELETLINRNSKEEGTMKVLDHGFVNLRNLAGPTRRQNAPYDAHDVDVANSARMSFNGCDAERSYEVEMKLNRYLLANKHIHDGN